MPWYRYILTLVYATTLNNYFQQNDLLLFQDSQLLFLRFIEVAIFGQDRPVAVDLVVLGAVADVLRRVAVVAEGKLSVFHRKLKNSICTHIITLSLFLKAHLD